MNGLGHSLVGYDRRSERMVEEFAIPPAILPAAKRLACVPPDDAEAMMCYPLDARGACALAALLDVRIDTDRRDYFLEGYGDPAVPSVGRASGTETAGC